MTDAPLVPKEENEAGTDSEPMAPQTDAGKMSLQGVPLDDETRMDLYQLRNEGADRQKLGEFTQTLSKEEFKNVQKSAEADGKATTINDVKGGESLVFPDQPEEQPAADAANPDTDE